MKTVNLYKCEICGTEYNEKAKCLKCEKNHKRKGEIVKMRYQSVNFDETGYPDKITVKFEDGVEKIYKR